MNNLEQLQNSQEYDVEYQKSAGEQLEKLKSSIENTVELSPKDAEAQTEKARLEALETAISVESGGKEKKKAKAHSAPSRRGSISKKQRNESYARTIKQVQNELPIGNRLFSKIIHNSVIEKTSDVIGSTIARPNAMLSGAVVAFVLTLLTYTIAKTIGYALSGFETIAAFIIGWILGIIYDYLLVLITGGKEL
jgi:flagellar biosynthesis/type III secretory pathway protein FliH